MATANDDELGFDAYTSAPPAGKTDIPLVVSAPTTQQESDQQPLTNQQLPSIAASPKLNNNSPNVAAPPRYARTNASGRRPNSGTRSQDEAAFRSALEPDDNSIIAKKLAARFRTALFVLLCLYLLVYLLESTVGQFSPTGPDMVLLFLGWYAQDNYRIRALKLYIALSSVSLIIDLLGFISTILYISSRSFPLWVSVVLVLLFLAESVFKIATIAHGRALRAHLDVVDRLPVESGLLRTEDE